MNEEEAGGGNRPRQGLFLIEEYFVGQLYEDANDSVEIDNVIIHERELCSYGSFVFGSVGGMTIERACRSSSCHLKSTSSKRLS